MGVDPDEFRAALRTARTYAVVYLIDGPDPSPANRDDVVMAHAMRNYELHKAGVMNVVGPMRSDNRVRGLCIIDGDLAKAKEVMDGDPAVQAGIFAYELDELMSFPGARLAD